MLAEWTCQPAPATMVFVPRSLRRRFAAVADVLLSRAITTTLEAHDGAPCEQRAAEHAHALLWALPSLVLRAEAGDPDEDLKTRSRHQVGLARSRLQHAEAGEWHILLRAALDERLAQQTAAAERDGLGPGKEPSATQRLGLAARKARHGCLRTATQILIGPGKAPPTAATVEQTWHLACREGGPDDAAALAAARKVAERLPGIHIPGRVVSKRVRLARAGAEPGPSGWRNAHIACVHDYAQDGRRTLTAWTQLWASGLPQTTGGTWRQACMVSLAKPNGGVRPLMLQEALLKLTENVLAEVQQKQLIAAAGCGQFGVGPSSRAHVAAHLIEAATADDTIEGVLSLDCANAFGSLLHAVVYWSLIASCPGLLPYLCCLWQDTGIRCWQREGSQWVSRHSRRGVPQGSPLAPWLYAIALHWLLYTNVEHRPPAVASAAWTAARDALRRAGYVAYVDDVTLWGSRTTLSEAWSFAVQALAVGGLEIKAAKSQLWLRGDQTPLPRVDVRPAPSITALGCSLHNDHAIHVGSVLQAAADSPTERRTRRAEQLGVALIALAWSRADECAVHAAFTLCQRTLCPALDFDARTAAPSYVRPRLARLDDAVQAVMTAIAGLPIGEAHMACICRRAELGGFAVRPPGRPGFHWAARWAGLRSIQPAVKKLAADYQLPGAVSLLHDNTREAAQRLLQHGVDTSTGLATLTADARAAVADCTPAAELLQHDEAGAMRGEQSTAARLAELAELGRCWATMDESSRRHLVASSGRLAGTVLASTPDDAREGWLEDDDMRTHVQLQLGAWGSDQGARCQLVPASGPHAGQPCGRSLGPDGQHLGPCRAGDGRVRIHNSARHALASCLSSFGVHTSEEVAVPAWARKDAQGRWHEAILDVEARVPGSTVATRVDVTIVATQSSKHKRTWPTVALGAADSAKVKRYGTGVAPLAVALRGRWSPAALQTLELLAGAASSTSGVPAIRVQRRLARAAAAAIASAEARTRIAALGGSAATRRLHNRLAHELPSPERPVLPAVT